MFDVRGLWHAQSLRGNQRAACDDEVLERLKGAIEHLEEELGVG